MTKKVGAQNLWIGDVIFGQNKIGEVLIFVIYIISSETGKVCFRCMMIVKGDGIHTSRTESSIFGYRLKTHITGEPHKNNQHGFTQIFTSTRFDWYGPTAPHAVQIHMYKYTYVSIDRCVILCVYIRIYKQLQLYILMVAAPLRLFRTLRQPRCLHISYRAGWR